MNIEETYLNIIKAIYGIPTANIILSGEKLKSFPSQIRNKTRMPTHSTSIQHRTESPSLSIRQEKQIKSIHIRKKVVKLSLFADCMILYTLLLLLSRFSHVWLCATPETAAHQAPPSLGFSRQEHWSGLPFPSPMHQSEKWKWSRSVVSDSSDPVDCSPPGSSIHGIF